MFIIHILDGVQVYQEINPQEIEPSIAPNQILPSISFFFGMFFLSNPDYLCFVSIYV